MDFVKIKFPLSEVNFKGELNDVELFGIERLANEVLGFDMDRFSYHGGFHAYHALDGQKFDGLNIEGFKMSKECLYLILSDEDENYEGYRLEFV